MIGSICEVKSGFRSCKEQSVARCIYCGRPFCAQHGVIQEDGQEICSRKECVAKRDDLVVHLAYKAAVAERNQTKHCGVAGCNFQMTGECIRCGGFFCERHVEKRVEKVMENKVMLQRVASLCEHCYKRREIWLKM